MKKRTMCLVLATVMILALALSGCSNSGDKKFSGGGVAKSTQKVESTDSPDKAETEDTDDSADKDGGKLSKETKKPADESDGELEIKPEKPELPEATKHKPSESGSWLSNTTDTAPAKLGEFVEISDFTGKGEPAGLRLDEVIQGAEANELVKAYMDSGNSIYEWDEPDDGTEFAVFKLTVDTSKLEIPDYGKQIVFSMLKLVTEGRSTLYDDSNTSFVSTTIQIDNERPTVKPGDSGLVGITLATLQFTDGSNDSPVVKIGSGDTAQYIEYK